MDNKETENMSLTDKMNEMYWKKMDDILDMYKKTNPKKYELAQKKGEEIMSFDYNNPKEFTENRDMIEYGKKVYVDVTFNGLTEDSLSEYDIKSLKCFLGKDDISDLFIE